VNAALVDDFACKEFQPLFTSLPNSKFLHSLSITLIFRHMHGAFNVGKKITNYTVWL
jgi:hypothetical protein